MCRRCDPEVTEGSALCHQCVNVYTRRGKVAPMARVNFAWGDGGSPAPQLDEPAGLRLGLVWSGAGHLFSGLPVRGARLLRSLFTPFAITAVVNRPGSSPPASPVALLASGPG